MNRQRQSRAYWMRKCKVCGIGFKLSRYAPHQKYCSIRCQRKQGQAVRRSKTQENRPTCQTPGCKNDVPYRSKKYCIPCSWARPREREKARRADPVHGEKMREYDRKRSQDPERKAYSNQWRSEYYKRHRAGNTEVAENNRKYHRERNRLNRDKINEQKREAYRKKTSSKKYEGNPDNTFWQDFHVPDYLK